MLSKKVSGAPVLDAAGKKLVGVLSETDLLWKEAGVPQDEWVILPLMLPSLARSWRGATPPLSSPRSRKSWRAPWAKRGRQRRLLSGRAERRTAQLQEAAQLMLR